MNKAVKEALIKTDEVFTTIDEDWVDRVELESLNMYSHRWCMAGRVSRSRRWDDRIIDAYKADKDVAIVLAMEPEEGELVSKDGSFRSEWVSYVTSKRRKRWLKNLFRRKR